MWVYIEGLFLKSKILSLKGTHNRSMTLAISDKVVSEVKDTKFERNSQLIRLFERENHSCIFGHFAVFHQILALPTPYSSKKSNKPIGLAHRFSVCYSCSARVLRLF